LQAHKLAANSDDLELLRERIIEVGSDNDGWSFRVQFQPADQH
jgi:hypothetical protein